MAIVRIFHSKNRKRRKTLKEALEYIADYGKTGRYTAGQYVNAQNAYDRMNLVQRFYEKEDGRDCIHFMVSFPEKEDPLVLLAFAERIAHEFPDFQILYAVHRNTAHSHVHFVMNSVCITDGHKFSQGPAEMEKFKESVGTYEQAFNLGEGCVEYYETDLDDGEWEYENLYDNIPEMPSVEDKDDYEEDELCNTLEEPMNFWNPTEDAAQTKEIQLPDSRCNGKGIDPWISFDGEGKEPVDPWISFDKDGKEPIDPWIYFDTGSKEPIDPWIPEKELIDPFIVYAEQKSNRSGWQSKMALMKATAHKQEKQGLGYIFRFFSNNNAKKERRIL